MRPLNLGETLDAAMKVVRAHVWTLAKIALVVLAPIEFVNGLITLSTADFTDGESAFLGDADYDDEASYIAGQLTINALYMLGYLFGTVACFRAIADAWLGRPVSASASLRFAARHAAASLWLSILYGLAVILGFVALIVPGIWLAGALAVAIPVLLVEGVGGVAALRRSAALVRGRWWATAGRLGLAQLIVLVVTIAILGFMGGALFLAVEASSTVGIVISGGASLLVGVITTPFVAAVTVLIYFDLRVRKEGFDLAILAERLGGPAATDPAPVTPGDWAIPGSAAPAGEGWQPAGAPEPGEWAPPVAPTFLPPQAPAPEP